MQGLFVGIQQNFFGAVDLGQQESQILRGQDGLFAINRR
jgi:hypothetical protein